jgi:Predicted amidohydrolase
MDILPVGLVQASILRKTPEANVESLLAEATRAGEYGARLVILPELWNVAYVNGKAECPVLKDYEALDSFCEVARRFGMGIVAGSMAVVSGKGKVNRSYAIGPDGKILLSYDKVHTFPSFFETGIFKPGSALAICDLFGWKIGLLVCFDLEFPELCRALVEKGADLLVVAGAWPADHIRIWRTLLVARAIENQVFTVGVNRCDKGTLVRFGGHSLAVDPFGETLLQLDDRPGTELAWLRKDLVNKARSTHAVWSSRRQELYRKWQ